jgi:hypothetical protein
LSALFEPAQVAREGKAQFPEAPGRGVEINPIWLESTDDQVSEMI